MIEEREARIGREQDFYNRVAEILHVDYVYIVPYYKKTRWNARCLGNGRFPGYGLIRMYGPNVIHIMLTHPLKITKTFESVDSALVFLGGIIEEKD